MSKKHPKHHKHKHRKPKHRKHPPHHPHNHHEKDSACTYIDEEICIEAKVTVNPDVSVDEIQVECLEADIERDGKRKHGDDKCTMIVSQLVRIKIPVRFSARANAEKNVSCNRNNSSDC